VVTDLRQQEIKGIWFIDRFHLALLGNNLAG